ncbi:MAG: PDZ domain-containing protein [Myxococcales bacterium]|nr:PDZ domain-containing protein [Myxococcales bacterium]
MDPGRLLARALLASLLLTGCAAAPPRPALPPQSEAASPAPSAPSAISPARPAPPATPAGAIRRAELERVLALSPGAFLSHVDPVPTFHAHRFAGWQLNAFFPGDARFAGVDLRPGDVVTRVNGKPIEQPEQFIQVWEGVRFRHELTVDIVRDRRPRTLTWTIID